MGIVGEGGATHSLFALVVGPLTTHPFEDGGWGVSEDVHVNRRQKIEKNLPTRFRRPNCLRSKSKFPNGVSKWSYAEETIQRGVRGRGGIKLS